MDIQILSRPILHFGNFLTVKFHFDVFKNERAAEEQKRYDERVLTLAEEQKVVSSCCVFTNLCIYVVSL